MNWYDLNVNLQAFPYIVVWYILSFLELFFLQSLVFCFFQIAGWKENYFVLTVFTVCVVDDMICFDISNNPPKQKNNTLSNLNEIMFCLAFQ